MITPASLTESPQISREHIVLTSDTCGGKPRIAGTRIRVQDVYVWHELQGQSIDQIVSRFPQLTHADIYAALAYYWDHREELDRVMNDEVRAFEVLRAKQVSPLTAKLKQRDAANDSLPSR